MPRRMIESSLGRSRSLAAVSIGAELAFVHALTIADDQGRFEGEPCLLRSDLFPRRPDLSTEEVAGWIDELLAEGCLHAYEVGPERYLHFPAWSDFQRLRKPGEDRLPSPEGICKGCEGQKRESRSVKRESGGERESAGFRGKPPQAAATRRNSPRTNAPEGLDKEQMEKLKGWCEEKHPDYSSTLEHHVEACLGFFRSEGRQKADWYATVQTWIRRQGEMGNGKNNGGKRGSGGKGVLERAYDDIVARS